MSNDPKQSWFQQHKFLTALLAFALVLVIITPYMDDGSDKSSSRSSTHNVTGLATSQGKNTDVSLVELNTPIDLGSHTMTVLSAREAKTISSRYSGPVSAAQGAKFVIVELQLTSQSTSDFTYFPDNHIRLVDIDTGRQFTTYENTIGSINDYLNVAKLTPSIAKKGVVVYEVPEDAKTLSVFGTNDVSNHTYVVGLAAAFIKSAAEGR